MSEFKFGLETYLEKYFECPDALELFTTPQTEAGRELFGETDIATVAKDYLLNSGAKQCIVETIHAAEHTYVLSASWIASGGKLETYYTLCFDY